MLKAQGLRHSLSMSIFLDLLVHMLVLLVVNGGTNLLFCYLLHSLLKPHNFCTPPIGFATQIILSPHCVLPVIVILCAIHQSPSSIITAHCYMTNQPIILPRLDHHICIMFAFCPFPFISRHTFSMLFSHSQA